MSIVSELAAYCWLKTCWERADAPRSIYCEFHSKAHKVGVWLWWFAAAFALVVMALSVTGCYPLMAKMYGSPMATPDNEKNYSVGVSTR